jgi:3-hydroxybutyryl-CoA dehydrogenase
LVEITKVLIIGNSEYARRIQSLFSKAGLQVVRVERGAKEIPPSDLVIEAVPADTQAKKQALAEFGGRVPECILATTANSEITAVATAGGRASRTVGLNFFYNPIEEKCLVQIVKGLETSTDTIEDCRSVVEKTDAVPVVVEDVPGLIVDRVMASTINEATFMLQTKVASMEDINHIPKLCLNWAIGPFELADLVGLDNIVATLEATSKDGQQYLPCRLLREMVAAGRLGRKTGKGFFDYTKKASEAESHGHQ